jgi:RNA polymerase sigma-70 factor (ECF subfamily)
MPNPASEAGAGAEADRADMACLLADQPAALDRIIQRHGVALHAYLFRWVQDAEDARDLALETFVRLHAHRQRFDPRRSLATWLYTIATNLARDRLRWRQRHPQTSLHDPAPQDGPSLEASLPDPGSDPSHRLLGEERAQAVRAAIAALPEDLRTVILLSEFENQPNAEIASILECSVKAVEMRLYRARHALRNQLSAWIL